MLKLYIMSYFSSIISKHHSFFSIPFLNFLHTLWLNYGKRVAGHFQRRLPTLWFYEIFNANYANLLVLIHKDKRTALGAFPRRMMALLVLILKRQNNSSWSWSLLLADNDVNAYQTVFPLTSYFIWMVFLEFAVSCWKPSSVKLFHLFLSSSRMTLCKEEREMGGSAMALAGLVSKV